MTDNKINKVNTDLKNSNKLEIFNFSINNIKNIKKLDSNVLKKINMRLYLGIVIFIVVIIWCSIIINYLTKINSCNCYNEENKLNHSNIQYLIIMEAIIIVFHIFFILVCSSSLYLLNNKSGGGKSDNPLRFIMTLLYIIIWGFFVYYVYKFSENVNENCSCTQSWVRYLLYIQSFYYLLSIFGILIMLFI